MKTLVLGAKGMLGQDLCPILENVGLFVVEADRENFDLLDFETTKEAIRRIKPNIIIHCAAYTNVEKAEKESELAKKINTDATQNIAIVANEIDATLIYISTDYVFDGEKTTPYTPQDKANPISVYGKTKFLGEEAVRKYCKKHYIARTSWLYGLYGKNFVETMLSLKDKEEIKVVDDQIGCPTWTVALSRGLISLIAGQKPYGTYHICSSGSTSWYGYAKEIFKLANEKVNLVPIKSEQYPQKAKRPKYSVMDNDNICPDWKVSLKEYFEFRNSFKNIQ